MRRLLEAVGFAKREEEPHRVLLLGLDGAGKTRLLYQLKLGDNTLHVIPTIGFNVETLEFAVEKPEDVSSGRSGSATTASVSVSCKVWDVGGQDKIRPLWRHYFGNTEALVFCVSGSDQDRLEEAGEAFFSVLGVGRVAPGNGNSMKEQMVAAKEVRPRGMPVLILVTHQDEPGALTPTQVAAEWDLGERLAEAGIECWRCVGVGFMHPEETDDQDRQKEVSERTREAFQWIVEALTPDTEPQCGVDEDAQLIKSARKRGAAPTATSASASAAPPPGKSDDEGN